MAASFEWFFMIRFLKALIRFSCRASTELTSSIPVRSGNEQGGVKTLEGKKKGGNAADVYEIFVATGLMFNTYQSVER